MRMPCSVAFTRQEAKRSMLTLRPNPRTTTRCRCFPVALAARLSSGLWLLGIALCFEHLAFRGVSHDHIGLDHCHRPTCLFAGTWAARFLSSFLHTSLGLD